ncbi:Serine hydroxymethyltransferase [Mycoplasmopsis californica]|uniref:Serine hydroxymethyltransferase n=1 Tax=Mycoplasmopsis equigenitalium TaxID=114883 RepID=A0ABY5J1Z7_9BACT|nr:serine hydroxymethyltransferase [Mycoplasmopsis equigenitalium]UUD36744.1 serine hydroxymethyltransferase [Mycoplasmopsis equigenitalium]VEU69962.1 Serine hydroxymethyltransferase [Mycoplasmopsis californica]
MYKKIKLSDKIIEKAINSELRRQTQNIELIASENYVSEDVLKATGSILTNKYGEGYPKKRYYGGCQNVDVVEQAAIDRLKELFGVKFANVQSYSGSVANAAALAALMPKGGKILGLSLASGGHLTHGYKISFSGIFYDAYTYEVDENGFLDYEAIKKIALEVKPNVIICGYSAYSRTIDFKKFREIADACGAKLMADIAHIAGLIAAGCHPSPVGYADVITSTTHKTLRGTRGAVIMTNDSELAKKIDRWVFPGYQGGPLFHAIAGKAVAFKEALNPGFKEYAKQIILNSRAFARKFTELGVKVITGGTDNHLFIIDVVKSYNLTGKEAEKWLDRIKITANKNTIPFDPLSPTVTSGLRFGTAAMTSRDFKEKDFEELALIIDSCLRDQSDHNFRILKEKVKAMTEAHPIKKQYFE